MEKQTLPTRVLLACGVVGGPLYVAVTLVEVMTRPGFTMRHHRFTVLTTGDLGWIHQLNMVLVGALIVLFAVGAGRVLRAGRGAVWVPRLLALFGVAYVVGGLLPADPMVGFPAGTTADMVHTTWHGEAQNVSRGVSSLLLLALSLVVARWFAGEGRRGWAWFYGTALWGVFLVLSAVGTVAGVNPVAPAFLATPWIWVTALAVHLYWLEATRSHDVPAGLAARPA